MMGKGCIPQKVMRRIYALCRVGEYTCRETASIDTVGYSVKIDRVRSGSMLDIINKEYAKSRSGVEQELFRESVICGPD